MCWLIWTLRAFLPITGTNMRWPQKLEWDRDSFWANLCVLTHNFFFFACSFVWKASLEEIQRWKWQKAIKLKYFKWVCYNTRFLVKLLQWYSKLYFKQFHLVVPALKRGGSEVMCRGWGACSLRGILYSNQRRAASDFCLGEHLRCRPSPISGSLKSGMQMTFTLSSSAPETEISFLSCPPTVSTHERTEPCSVCILTGPCQQKEVHCCISECSYTI